jgi:antitoxin ParD1/3/4
MGGVRSRRFRSGLPPYFHHLFDAFDLHLRLLDVRPNWNQAGVSTFDTHPGFTRFMINRKTMNISLTAELERSVADRVASGRYHSASEVVRAALRLLDREEKEDFRHAGQPVGDGLAFAPGSRRGERPLSQPLDRENRDAELPRNRR